MKKLLLAMLAIALFAGLSLEAKRMRNGYSSCGSSCAPVCEEPCAPACAPKCEPACAPRCKTVEVNEGPQPCCTVLREVQVPAEKHVDIYYTCPPTAVDQNCVKACRTNASDYRVGSVVELNQQ